MPSGFVEKNASKIGASGARNAGAVVLDLEDGVARLAADAEDHVPPAGPASASIAFCDEVQEDLLDLRRVPPRGRLGRQIARRGSRARRRLRREERHRALAERAHRVPVARERLGAREIEELRDELREPLDLVADDADRLEHLGVAVALLERALEERDVELRAVERVADLVREARGERADRGELLVLPRALRAPSRR